MAGNNEGWAWFETAIQPAPGEAEMFIDGDSLAALAARCFRSADGKRFLGVLRRMTVERSLGPNAPEPLLRHLEGQRQLVKYMETLVAEGTFGPNGSLIDNLKP